MELFLLNYYFPLYDREKEYEVEKILNKKRFRERDQYLVQQKGYTVEEDIWEPRENLGNAEELIKEFKEEYSEIGRVKKRENDKENKKRELSGRYMAKMLYRQDNKRFKLERNWRKWKGKEEGRLERINEKEEKEEIKEE